jgi:hypothetical protein
LQPQPTKKAQKIENKLKQRSGKVLIHKMQPEIFSERNA